MQILTEQLHPNEPCYGLWEGPEVAPIPGSSNGATGWRWLQKVFVVRGDTIAKHVMDLGHADLYARIQPLFLPNDGADSVSALQFWAEKNRNDTYWADYADEQLAQSTLISDILQQNETLRESVANRSSFGPYQNSPRNGYSLITAERQAKQRRQDRTKKVVTYGSGS